MRAKKEVLYSVLEYFLAFMFIQGGIKVFFFSDPIVLPGVFAFLVGAMAVQLYGFSFFAIGCTLVAGKVMKRKRLHKHSLLAMYLTCIYVLILAIMINGLGWGLLTTVVVGIVAAGLWVRWKFKTEYIDPDAFYKTIEPLRDDLPPA